ncbi:MAG: hypothetical protein FJZ56_00030 [Chlamydiae bacterium]|nr:hypothetical protein [Chlamydiota bacterium]
MYTIHDQLSTINFDFDYIQYTDIVSEFKKNNQDYTYLIDKAQKNPIFCNELIAFFQNAESHKKIDDPNRETFVKLLIYYASTNSTFEEIFDLFIDSNLVSNEDFSKVMSDKPGALTQITELLAKKQDKIANANKPFYQQIEAGINRLYSHATQLSENVQFYGFSALGYLLDVPGVRKDDADADFSLRIDSVYAGARKIRDHSNEESISDDEELLPSSTESSPRERNSAILRSDSFEIQAELQFLSAHSLENEEHLIRSRANSTVNDEDLALLRSNLGVNGQASSARLAPFIQPSLVESQNGATLNTHEKSNPHSPIPRREFFFPQNSSGQIHSNTALLGFEDDSMIGEEEENLYGRRPLEPYRPSSFESLNDWLMIRECDAETIAKIAAWAMIVFSAGIGYAFLLLYTYCFEKKLEVNDYQIIEVKKPSGLIEEEELSSSS